MILAVDSLTGEPLIVRATLGAGTIVHAVPHWWQERGISKTQVDRRRLADIPSFQPLGQMAGDVTLGEFQAARTMTAGLFQALRPMVE